MICPQCGLEQPESPACARCGMAFEPRREPLLQPLAPAYAGVVGVGAIYGGAAAPASASAADVSPGRFPSGPILAETFAIYFANFLPFLAISCVALLPRIAVAVLDLALKQWIPARSPWAPLLASLLGLAGLVTQSLGIQVATGAIAYGVLRHLRGAEAAFAEDLKAGLQAMGRVLGVALLSGLIIGLGMLALVVPGVLLAVRWAVVVPVVLEEAPGASAALARSGELTEGHRWSVFGILFALWAIDVALWLVVGIALRASSGRELALVATAALTTGLGATASAVMYYRLRSRKESLDVRDLVSVFD